MGMNTFGAGEMKVVHIGDEHFSAGDERVENARLSFNHTHTLLATRDF